MVLFWKVRYWDRCVRDLKDRCLWLETKSLDPVTRAAVELASESKNDRDILKYRHLFLEEHENVTRPDFQDADRFKGVSLHEYFEDETCKVVTLRELGPLLTGNPDTLLAPSGAKKHDIEYMLADRKPICLGDFTLDPDEVRLLAYFSREIQELSASSFIYDGPGKLTKSGNDWKLRTAVTPEEIGAFVTTFRRLYMDKEPANFQKAVALFVKILGDRPYGKWVGGMGEEYEEHLASVPRLPPSTASRTFTTKRLLDVYIYTQYAHQPDERRERQFADCLAEVHGNKALLGWLFLSELFGCSLNMLNAGRQIEHWFSHYCREHKVSPAVLNTLGEDHSGLGTNEKEHERQKRLFREQAERIAADFWERAGRPHGGPEPFFAKASEELARMLKK